MTWLEVIRKRANEIRSQSKTLAIVVQDPQLAWPARLVGIFVIAYALSPIDLIPDFIPVLGLLDDVILIPIGIAIFIKLIPKDLWERAEMRANETQCQPTSRLGLILIPLTWLVILVATLLFSSARLHN